MWHNYKRKFGKAYANMEEVRCAHAHAWAASTSRRGMLLCGHVVEAHDAMLVGHLHMPDCDRLCSPPPPSPDPARIFKQIRASKLAPIE